MMKAREGRSITSSFKLMPLVMNMQGKVLIPDVKYANICVSNSFPPVLHWSPYNRRQILKKTQSRVRKC